MVTSGKKFLSEQQARSNAVQKLSTGTGTPTPDVEIPKGVSNIIKSQAPKYPSATISEATPEQKAQLKEIEYVESPRNIVDVAKQGVQRVTSKIAGTDIGTAYEQGSKMIAEDYEISKQVEEKGNKGDLLFEGVRTGTSPIDVLAKSLGIDKGLNEGRTNNEGDTVYLTNGNTIVSKPIVRSLDSTSTLGDAYNSITYEYAQNGGVLTAEQIKETYPEWQDVSDDTINAFIQDCLYDVETDNRRDINQYADFYGALSVNDNYANKQDSLLDALTDEDIIAYGISAFAGGAEKLEGRTPEEIIKYIQSAMIIKDAANQFNEFGYNISGASDYNLVRSILAANKGEADIKELQDAFNAYTNFNLTANELNKIQETYDTQMNNLRELRNTIDSGDTLEYGRLMSEYANRYISESFNSKVNTMLRETYTGDSSWIKDKLYSLMFGNAYEEDGKYYDTNGNEIKQDEISKGISRALVDSWINLGNQLSDLDYDIDRTVNDRDNDRNFFDQINVDYEKLGRIGFDIPSTVFAGIMSLTPGGVAFTTATGLPYIGAKLDNVFNYVMGGISDIAIGLGNLIGFTDGWNEKTIEKYGEAVSAVATIKIAQGLKVLGRRGVDYLKYKTAIGRAVKVYTDRIKAGAKLVDVLKEKEKIRRTTTPKLPEEAGDTTGKIESKAKDVKSKVDVDIQGAKYKMQIAKAVFQDALNNFHKTFQEEAAKIKEETGGETILDTLFETASKLFKDSQKLRVAEGEVVENIPETVKDVTEISVQEPTKTTTEPQRETTVESEAMPAPEVRVEETVTEAPETVEGTAEVKETEGTKEVRTTIAKILDLMKDIEDNAKEAIDNIFKPDLEKQTRKEIEEREARDELFRREGLTEKQIEVVENNPFTDSVIRIVDRLVSEITDKKGNVKDTRLEDKMSNDEIQREVLSDGLTRMQKYVDRIQQMKKAIGKLYDALSTQKNIRSRQFLYSEPFQRLLRENGLEYVERLDDKGNPKRAVVANDGRALNANERAVVKYLESMVDIITEKSWISEKDAHNIRTNFTSKGDWDSSGNFPKAVKKTLYERWNEFLEQQGSSEMLRKIDQGYADLSENLEVLSDLLGKDSMLKDNAKNQILKRDEETLDQMESLLPGIKKLVELTKQSPDIVNKTIKAKTQYKQTRVWLGNWIRYAGVMLASTVGGRGGFVLGSLGFTTLERLGNALKSKAVKTKLDRDLYNQYVEALKVDGNTKASFKKGEIERYNELSKIAEGKTQAEIDKLLDDATQILIDRQAAKIREQKQAEWERYLRSQGVGDTTPRLPESAQGGVEATDTFTLPEDRGVKETYKDKEKIQQGYNQGEQQIIDASLGKTEEATYSPEAEKIADILEKSLNETADIIEEDAANKVIEKGEELTDENIAKEIQKEPSSIEEFIIEAEKGAPEKTTNYDGADIKDLEEVVANPKKYPNVDIEAAKAALEKARRQNMEAEIIQSPDQQQAQKEIAGIYKGNQMEREGNKGREKQREDMVRETNRDFNTLETTEEYDRIESQITPEQGEMAQKYSKGYKGFYRADKAKTDTLRADMGKKPSQNITYTSSADKIATLESPKSRARVAQERLNKKKRLSEEEKTKLNQIIEQANVEIQAKEELKAQKTELANEYKALDKKRSETPYKETKKEITKKMDKISDEFDKLTYEEAGELFSKPKEVEEAEAKEQGEKQEFDKAMDENETPQKAEPEIKEQETKKESEGERSFGDEEYTNRDNKIEGMSKDESITIKDTINEVDEIVGGGIKDYQEKIYGEKRDKEESYTNDGAESFRNRVNDKIGERDRKFWEDQRSKTKDMESSKLTKEQEKQLEEAKTKEEKDALMNKWRKEYIERNPIAEEYLKEAEEHNKQFEKAMNALGKLDAIVRRIRRKRREDIDKRWEEAKRKLREEKKKEIDLLDQNETPQIDEIPQEVSSEKVVEGEQKTSVEELFGRQPKKEKTEKPVTSEKISTYEWKGKQNMEEFEKKFEGDKEDGYTEGVDEYGEVVGQPKEVKLRNFVQKTFGKVDRSSSAFRDSQYDEQVAMATEIVNTNISYKDITLKYYRDTGDMKSDKGTSETAKAYFDRDNVQLGIGDPNYKYSPLHEVHHGLDYKFAQELGFDGEIGLSRIVTEKGFKAEGKHKDLIQRFQNLMNDIMRKQSKIKDDKILSPDETFARFGEAFGQWTKGEKIGTSASDYFGRDTNLFQRYVDWLSDMADAREEGNLNDGGLKKTETNSINEITGLHGSTTKFDKFDPDKIQPGMYGFGFYFTDDMISATRYARHQFGYKYNGDIKYKGELKEGIMGVVERQMKDRGGNLNDSIKEAKSTLERISNKYPAKDVQETKDMLENIKESDFEDLGKGKRHLYYNEIPDTGYIDWNGKLSDKDLSKINGRLKELGIDFRWDNNVSTEVNYIKLGLSVGGGARGASDFLNSLGFNGIEVKNADGHVHVVFDRDKIGIKRVENF